MKSRSFLFLSLLLASFFLWSCSVFTTSIESISIGYLGFFHELPIGFFAGFCLLILATIVWHLSHSPNFLYHLLIPLWVLYIFVGPEIAEVNARGGDTFFHLYGVNYVVAGDFKRFHYAPYPGYFYFSAILYQITGIRYHELAKLLNICLHLIMTIGGLGLFHKLTGRGRESILATIIFLALLWCPGTYTHPVYFGFILMLYFLTVLFSPNIPPLNWKTLLIFFFMSIVISHPLPSLIITGLVIFRTLISLNGREFEYHERVKEYGLALLYGVMFIAWLLYSSDWALSHAIWIIRNFIIENFFETATTHYTASESPFRAFVVYSTYAFYLFLFSWLSTILGRSPHKLGLKKLSPILYTAVIVAVTVLTSQKEGLQRGYYFATPFIAWFLASRSPTRKKLTTCFLTFLLIFGFFLRYNREYLEVLPTTEFKGIEFICESISPSDTILYEWATGSLGSNHLLGYLVNKPQAPLAIGIKILKERPPIIKQLDFAIDSTINKNALLYYHYYDGGFQLIESLYQVNDGLIYNNGYFKIYFYRMPPI